MRVMVAVLCLMLLPVGARADIVDGNKFLQKCESGRDDPYCHGYISGLVDALQGTICVPAGTLSTQLLDTLVLWLQVNPEKRSMNTGKALWLALLERPFCARQ